MMPDPGMRDGTVTVTALSCAHCGALDPGPRELCAGCGSPDLIAKELPGTGTLVSWTMIRRAPTRFKGQAPYPIAVVDLAAGVRVTGRLRGGLDHMQLGTPLVAVGIENGAYMFEEQSA
jgi:uncharacterized OB-fold protein